MFGSCQADLIGSVEWVLTEAAQARQPAEGLSEVERSGERTKAGCHSVEAFTETALILWLRIQHGEQNETKARGGPVTHTIGSRTGNRRTESEEIHYLPG